MGQITNTKLQHARATFRGTYEKLLETPGVALPDFLHDLRSRRVIQRALKECGLPRKLEREMTMLVLTLYIELNRAPLTSTRELRQLHQLRRWISRVTSHFRRMRAAMDQPHFVSAAPDWGALTDDTLSCLERYSLSSTPRGPKISPNTTAVWMLVEMALKHEPNIGSSALTELAKSVLEPAVAEARSPSDAEGVDWRENIVRALREHRRP
jgi:uncharacterized membrane protein YccC